MNQNSWRFLVKLNAEKFHSHSKFGWEAKKISNQMRLRENLSDHLLVQGRLLCKRLIYNFESSNKWKFLGDQKKNVELTSKFNLTFHLRILMFTKQPATQHLPPNFKNSTFFNSRQFIIVPFAGPTKRPHLKKRWSFRWPLEQIAFFLENGAKIKCHKNFESKLW